MKAYSVITVRNGDMVDVAGTYKSINGANVKLTELLTDNRTKFMSKVQANPSREYQYTETVGEIGFYIGIVGYESLIAKIVEKDFEN